MPKHHKESLTSSQNLIKETPLETLV